MKKTLQNTSLPLGTGGLRPTEMVAFIHQLQQQLADRDTEIRQQNKLLEERNSYIAILEEKLRLKKIQQYAARSEKMKEQIALFDEAELETCIDALSEQLPEGMEEEDAPRPARRKQRERTQGFSPKLERERIEIRLGEEEKAGASKTFFTKVKEELHFIPAQLKVREYWQEKAVFEHDGEEQVIAAHRPPHPLGRCSATPALLAYIITSKYADGLPLYRQEQMFKRLGQPLSRTSMAHWIIRLDDVFKPLIRLMREVQNSGTYLQADETRIQVLKEDGKSAQSNKWMWVTRGGPPGQLSVLFEYDPSRGNTVPVRLLDDFHGVLQADGYSGYAKICTDNHLTLIGCWDHARRKFVEAGRAAATPKGKNQDVPPSRAEMALAYIHQLYAIEKHAREMSNEERFRVRQEKSLPVLTTFRHWLEDSRSKVMPKSLTGKAISYALNQWDALVGYCTRGDLHISNALAENAIRPFAVGRKAWLFADTREGAQASATCYSLIETARANGLEPSAYILHLLSHIAEANTVEKLEVLLPWNVEDLPRLIK